MDTSRVRGGAVKQVYTINPGRVISILDGDGSTTHDLTFGNGVLADYESTAGGVWWLSGGVLAPQCEAAYQAVGAASYAASKVNLNNPSVDDAVDGAAFPTWNAVSGWTFNGVDQYLDTGIVPADTDWSYICRFAGSPLANDKILFGTGSSLDTTGLLIYPTSSSPGVYYNHYEWTGNLTLPSLQTGILGMADRACYRNGVPDGVVPAVVPPIPNVSLVIGAWNDNGVVGSFFEGDILAFAIYNATLSDAQMLAISTAMAAL